MIITIGPQTTTNQSRIDLIYRLAKVMLNCLEINATDVRLNDFFESPKGPDSLAKWLKSEGVTCSVSKFNEFDHGFEAVSFILKDDDNLTAFLLKHGLS